MVVASNGIPSVLTLNAGSSSVRWALFRTGSPPVRASGGKIERIGFAEGVVATDDSASGQRVRRSVHVRDHAAAVLVLIEQLAQSGRGVSVQAIGHRVVHGGNRYVQSHVLTPEVMEELHRLSPYDPEHLPAEITLIEAFGKKFPHVPQVACFDTAFHSHLPRVARLLAVPRRYEDLGVRRYGFHGLSYAYLMEELERSAGREAARGKVILAHLGNGASLAAVRDGRCIDTTMGFTPASGLPMGTRSGDLDPGLLSYLSKTEGMTVEQWHDMVNARSGLLGLSETSSDMKDLLDQERHDVKAAEAVALFCYQGKKWIGAYVAALGGLDQLVFSGGIGEHAAEVRARLCEGLECLGIRLDRVRNEAGDAVISGTDSQVTVRVIRTDEESQIARSVCSLLALNAGR